MDIEVLNRYFQGNCSSEEILLVDNWFKTAEGEKYLSESIEKDISLVSTEEVQTHIASIDSEELLKRILATKAEIENILSQQKAIKNSEPALVKTKTYSTTILHWTKYAAVLTGLLIVFFAFWLINKPDKITEQTGFGETKTVVLPDGSTIILNGNTELTYLSDWNTEQEREVWLDGEAFFLITHQSNDQKFIVNTSDNFNIEVLGTTFNVLKREHKTKVVLNSGKIKLNIKPEEKTEEHLLMIPGELVEFDNASVTYIKKKVNPEAHSSWKSNKIIFENTSLSEILLLLEHTYGLSVEVRDPNLLTQKLNGTIPNENVGVLLDGLSHLFNLKISKNNQKVIIENE